MNWDEITAEVGGILHDALDDVVTQGRADLKAYAADIAKDLVDAIRNDRADLRRELFGQALLLAELHRIRLNRTAKTVLSQVLEVAARVGKALLAGLI